MPAHKVEIIIQKETLGWCVVVYNVVQRHAEGEEEKGRRLQNLQNITQSKKDQ